MARLGYFDHTNLQDEDPTARGKRVGYDCRHDYGTYYYEGLGENIAQYYLYSSATYLAGVEIRRNYYTLNKLAAEIVDGWMNSPGHRENILNTRYDRAGIGVAVDAEEAVYATQNFCDLE